MNQAPHNRARIAGLTTALVRAAFGKGREADAELFTGVSEMEWKAVYEFSSRQGVLPLAWDGIAALPGNLRPPKSLALAWGVNTDISAERYDKQKNVIAELARYYAGNGIRMLLLKGYGLSLCYPDPRHRECGDIDAYLFGDFDKANRLAEESGASVAPELTKHTAFLFRGVMVENHRDIVDAVKDRRLRHLETVLEKLAAEEARETPLDDTRIWLPPATFNAIYLVAHAAAHFNGGELALRNICDWARFLETEGGSIDRELAARTIREARLDTLCSLMTAFAEEHLGLPPQGLPGPGAELSLRFENLVSDYRAAIPKNEGLMARIRRIWSNRWRSGKVLHRSYLYELYYTARLRQRSRKQKNRQGNH